ncbi:MAG: DNA-3-methyladenine glycosylase, partial [Planctomycetota bacterium]|nr:DNA-3-methyladenine glycosylase [Planctomycetota bacterium]
MTVLNLSFFSGSTVEVARKLIGKVLCRRSGNLLMKCRLVEVEAYLAEGDAACHAAKRKTPRNEVMFGPAGLVYVYSIHARYCMNFVTEKA